jgi:large subunit ribosomal protein L4
MATLTIRKNDGSEAGSLELADGVFGVEPNAHCVRDAVAQFLANQRAGTHATKMRGAVSGGGRKPWKQKGTGRARQGSIRSPQWRGGAIIFGPQPRDYSYRINQKVRAKAYCSVWSDLLASGKLIVVDSFGLDAPKSRRLVEILETLGAARGRTLLVSDATDEMMALSARNIPWVTPLNADNLNIYDLLTHDFVVVTTDVIKRVEATYA